MFLSLQVVLISLMFVDSDQFGFKTTASLRWREMSIFIYSH